MHYKRIVCFCVSWDLIILALGCCNPSHGLLHKLTVVSVAKITSIFIVRLMFYFFKMNIFTPTRTPKCPSIIIIIPVTQTFIFPVWVFLVLGWAYIFILSIPFMCISCWVIHHFIFDFCPE